MELFGLYEYFQVSWKHSKNLILLFDWETFETTCICSYKINKYIIQETIEPILEIWQRIETWQIIRKNDELLETRQRLETSWWTRNMVED